MASERAAALADDFAATNAEAVAFTESCGEDAWARPVPEEGWSVGVVLHHVAEGHGNSLRWLEGRRPGTASPTARRTSTRPTLRTPYVRAR